MANKKEDKNIECIVLKVWTKSENQERGARSELRTVDWVINGKHYIKTEFREFFVSQDSGEWKMGKAKGFSHENLMLLEKNWPELMRLHGSKLPEHQKAAAGAPAQAAVDAAAGTAQEPEDF